ncbi:MAG: hypothetical protein IT286_05465 [Proteobacteria bacterium]|jgi:hypothetical protein|nr:hypothetical protein [Pseudomonadota bacterium]
MKRNGGQIFPACVMLIAMLLVLILSNFEISFLNFRKIQQQKKMDGFAMHYAADYAKALNALAALNDGLATVRNRAWLVSGAEAALLPCAPYQWKKCGLPLVRLTAELPRFYSRVNKLGKEMVKQQEQIISWMLQTRCQANTELSRTAFADFQLYPVFPCAFRSDYAGLPFYRPYDDYTNPENQGVENCKTATYTSYNSFKSLTSKLANKPVEETVAQFKVTYQSTHNNLHFEKPIHANAAHNLPYSMQKIIRQQPEKFDFAKAEITYCAKFGQVLGSISEGIPAFFEIPAPLVFKSEFFTRDNKIIFMASDSLRSQFKKPLQTFYRQDDQSTPSIQDKVWGLTEVIIEGEDFRKMEFNAKMSAVTLQNGLERVARIKNPLIDWPDLIRNKNEILH